MLATESNDKAYSLQPYQNEELKSLTRYRFDKVNQRSRLKQSLSRLITLISRTGICSFQPPFKFRLCYAHEISECQRCRQISTAFSDKSFGEHFAWKNSSYSMRMSKSAQIGLHHAFQARLEKRRLMVSIVVVENFLSCFLFCFIKFTSHWEKRKRRHSYVE